ncbi:MAG: hypothetical protein Q9195_006952 [Heterodermia aff. obscurata]
MDFTFELHGAWNLEAYLSSLETLNPGSLPPEERLCSICRLPYAPASDPSTESPTPINLDGNDKEEEPTDEHPVKLPCAHIFGNQCLKTWLTPKIDGGGDGRDCPVCRVRISPDDISDFEDQGDDEIDSDSEEYRNLRRAGLIEEEEEEEELGRRHREDEDEDSQPEDVMGYSEDDEMEDRPEEELDPESEVDEELDPADRSFYRPQENRPTLLIALHPRVAE